MAKKKKVLIFSLSYYPRFVGGDGVAMKEITDRINPEEVQFDMITLRLDRNFPRQDRIGNVNIYRVGFSKRGATQEELVRFPLYLTKVLFPIQAFFKALSLHRREKYDLVWAMMTYSGFPAIFFNFFHRDVPILLTLQDGDPVEKIVGRKRIKLVYPLLKKIFKVVSEIQTISHYLADFAKSMGYRGEPKVVPNGVDLDNFRLGLSGVQEREQIRKELGFQETDEVLITTSRLVPKNGVGDVIKALPSLPDNIKFLVIGEGYMEKDLRILAREQSVAHRVVWHGFVSHEELPKYLAASDIFIRPSLSEGFGNSFVEAFAMGLPTIGTPVGGIVDFLQDPTSQSYDGTSAQTGYLCEPGNLESISTAIMRSISDPNKSQVLENARKLVVEKYNWDRIALQMKEIFESTVVG